MVLTFSMAFSSYTPKNNAVENSIEPISADPPTGAILIVDDALYYNVVMEGYDEMDDRYYEDNAVVKLVVNATGVDYITYMPYFYKFDGTNWAWEEDPSEDEDPHMKDDYNYLAYNHSWSVATDVGEMYDVNQTEDIEGKFASDMNSSVVTADFSTGADTYHNITLSCDRDDNSSTPVFVEWIGNKTTGLCVSYTETGIDDNITAELCGYEIVDSLSTGLLTVPTSFGFAEGDWIDYFVPENERYDEPPSSSGDASFDDWLERGNDDWTTAFHLNDEFEVPGHWHELSLHNNFDYYSFYAYNGDNINVDAWCEDGADITLEEIDSGNGNIIQYDHEDGDSDGEMHISWTATFDGYYMIGFTSQSGPFDDRYDFQISIDGDGGPAYFPEDGSDHHDGPESMFIHQTIEYLYTNPLGEEVLIVKSEGHKDADMMDTPLFVDYREQGRIDPDNINIIDGPYFHKDLDMNHPDFKTSMQDLLSEDGTSTSTFYNTTNWVELTGVTDEGADFYFFVERFPDHNYGAIQYYEQSEFNTTEDYFIKKDKNIAIDSSISGLINDTVGPELGVAVGDYWTYLAQESGYENSWDEYGGYDRSYDNLHYVTITVTHIFHANRTVVAVIGEMEHWSNDDPDYPDRREFQPILVWDTEDPMSFFTYGGHGQMQDGPPFLLPAGVDWSLHESEFGTLMEEANTYKINIDPNSIRVSWEGDPESEYYESGRVFLDVNSDGVVTHISQDSEERKPDYKRRNRLEGFATYISTGCAEILASTVTEVVTGDQFIWENQRYSPAGSWGSDDPGSDPNNYTHIRDNILTVEETCGEFIVFIGAREYRNWDQTDYHGNTWKYWDEALGDYVDTEINQWLLGSIQDANIWSWMNSQYFDIGLANFSGYEIELAELLNFAIDDIPDGYSIHPTDITVDGLTFELLFNYEESPGVTISHVMKFAVNNKGIMQEMFMGIKDSADNWLEWEYTVLISAPSGYDVGNVFDGLPVEDIHGLQGSGFEIPGYSGAFLVIASVFGIFSLLALISNRRRF